MNPQPVPPSPEQATDAKGLSFRWRYVALPLAILLASVLLSAYFYPRLPGEVAAHFELSGTPDGWLSRGLTLVVVLAPLLFLALMATAFIWGTTKFHLLSKRLTSIPAGMEGLLLFMGNAFALPQLIIGFAMLDIFSYNAYQRHLMPMLAFLLIVLGLATATLAILLALAISKARKTSRPGQSTKE